MCTVTYVATSDKIFLTSNRDEKPHRRKADITCMDLQPGSNKLLFPKDVDTGGSWIGLKDNGDAGVLLNGAFFSHQRNHAYRKSRGLVFLDIVGEDDPLKTFDAYDLDHIEPFTLILFVNKRLFECRWDGVEKFSKELDAAGAYIWSSATLYNEEVKKKREKRFDAFLLRHPHSISNEILNFHNEDGLKVNLPGKIQTVSITSIEISGTDIRLRYDEPIWNLEILEPVTCKP